MKLEDGYVRLNKNYSMLTDQYELNMANSYFESGMKDTVGFFDVFFRSQKHLDFLYFSTFSFNSSTATHSTCFVNGNISTGCILFIL